MSQLNYLLNLLQPKLKFDPQATIQLMSNYNTILSVEDKAFIEAKSKELMTVDDEIEKSVSEDGMLLFDDKIKTQLLELQFNILNLYLRNKLPKCDKALNSIFGTITKKITAVNEILQDNLSSKSSTVSPRLTLPDIPTDLESSDKLPSKQRLSLPDPEDLSQPSQRKEEKFKVEYEQPKKGNAVATDLVRVENPQNASTIKLDTKAKLVKYLNDFNAINIDSNSSDKKSIEPEMKTKLIDGIDNPNYKTQVIDIMKDTFSNDYSFANIFSLPEAVDDKLEDAVKEQKPVAQQPDAQNQAIDFDAIVAEFIDKNNLNDQFDEKPLPDTLKQEFMNTYPNILKNSQVKKLIDSKIFSQALLAEIRGI